ncbi:MAG: hypothetical protein HYZ20_19725 [Burkholderiales bacterium]|nr:hypothetical protein [Burkholderiales bacterium]
MKRKPVGPRCFDITIDTPRGPYRGQWRCDAQRASGQIAVWSADGRREATLGAHWPWPEVLAGVLLAEIARAAGKLT